MPHVPPAPVLQTLFQLVSFGSLIVAGLLQSRAADDDSSNALDVPTALAGAELGLWLFLGQAVQLQGLQRTDAAVAGFFVQLTTVLVPLCESLLLRRQLSPRLWGACASATAGLAVISAEALQAASGGGGGGGSSALLGDALVACSALLYTTHVIRLGEYASRVKPLPLARAKAGSQLVYGIGTLTALSLGGGLDANGVAGAITPNEGLVLLAVALWNGIVPSAFTTWAQTYGQAAVSPSAANVLYSFQPVWNAGLAALVLHETIDSAEAVGGALIVLAAILAAGDGGAEEEPASA